MALLMLTSCKPPTPPVTPNGPRVGNAMPPGVVMEAEALPLTPSAPPPGKMDALPVNLPVVKIGLLLPLSGESQALGQSMLNAATLAIYDHYLPMKPGEARARVVLIPKDTGDSPLIAAAAAKEAIAQGAAILIGPVFSNTVLSVAPIAQAANIPVIALSNNRAVAGNGVFIFGFTPEAQVERVVNYAYMQKTSTFASFLPNDAYGRNVQAALKATAGSKGALSETQELYVQSDENRQAALKRVAEAYKNRPFDMLLLAEGGAGLPALMAALDAQGINRSKVQFLGTGIWDDDAPGKISALTGAWFASGNPARYGYFMNRFTQAYGSPPQRLAGLAYDAVMAVSGIATSAGRAPSREALLAVPEFEGPANGAYRFRQDGTIERTLAVLEVTPDGVKVVDPAPRSLR